MPCKWIKLSSKYTVIRKTILFSVGIYFENNNQIIQMIFEVKNALAVLQLIGIGYELLGLCGLDNQLWGRFGLPVLSLFILSLLALRGVRILLGVERRPPVMFLGNKLGVSLRSWVGFLSEGGSFGEDFGVGVFLKSEFPLITPTTFRLMMASDVPAMFWALQRYSPASLYEIPFRLITDQRNPLRGDSCTTAHRGDTKTHTDEKMRTQRNGSCHLWDSLHLLSHYTMLEYIIQSINDYNYSLHHYNFIGERKKHFIVINERFILNITLGFFFII